MKHYKLITILGLCALWMTSGLSAESEEANEAAETSAQVELPEGVTAPQVVRLLRMSDEELASLRHAVEFVESMDEEEKGELRRTIGQLRRSEARRSGETRRERGERAEPEAGPLREEWQAFREQYEEDGESLEDLSPVERRALFREHLREQRETRGREAGPGQRQRQEDQRSRGNPRGGPRQSD
ncbi:MAG: hypothetical protein LAT55_09590 [Opitutales bacterium]|nr:hypothetical protein [Opitutales bacterium]